MHARFINSTTDRPATSDQDDPETFIKGEWLSTTLNQSFGALQFLVFRDPRTGDTVITIRGRMTGELLAIAPVDLVMDLFEKLPDRAQKLAD
jgi:hypothetical protein